MTQTSTRWPSLGRARLWSRVTLSGACVIRLALALVFWLHERTGAMVAALLGLVVLVPVAWYQERRFNRRLKAAREAGRAPRADRGRDSRAGTIEDVVTAGLRLGRE